MQISLYSRGDSHNPRGFASRTLMKKNTLRSKEGIRIDRKYLDVASEKIYIFFLNWLIQS